MKPGFGHYLATLTGPAGGRPPYNSRMVALPTPAADARPRAAVEAPDGIEPMTAHLRPVDADLVRRAWDFAQTLYGARHLPSGENMLAHARGILAILDHVRADAAARAAGVLFSAAELLAKPDEQLTEAFGPEIADIALGVRQLARIGERTRPGGAGGGTAPGDARAAEQQVETLRKMLLAFASDIRVVLVRLASRL